MRKSAKTFINWITDQQQLLLKAAILDTDEAIDAWDRWKSVVDLETVDYESMRALPMAYYNLRGRVREDRFLNLCKGNYRRTWLINKILFDSALPALCALSEENIKILLLKGSSVILRYYNDFGVRPMGDLDFLVPLKDRKKAFKILRRIGWKPDLQDNTWKDFIKVRFKHSIDFEKAGRHIDLHWKSTRFDYRSEFDDDLWKDSVPYNFGGLATRCLSPEDELLLIIVHGARNANNFYSFQQRPVIHWIIDAMRILSHSHAIDWHKFVTRARTHVAGLQIKEALNYLKDSWNAPIPPDAIQRISSNPSTIELFHYAYISGDREPLGRILKLRVWWGKYMLLYLRTYGEKHFSQLTSIQKFVGFLKFLQIAEFQTDSFWKFPIYFIRSMLS